MIKYVSCVIALLVLSSNIAWTCGKERWPVKVLTDKDRAQIHKTAKNERVSVLGGLHGPPNTDRTSANGNNHRLGAPEETTYRVSALLLGYRKESDGDFHLVLQDPNDANATMIAEIPDPQCVQDSTLATQLGNFRQQLVAKFGAPGKKTKRLPNPVPITLRGIGFFDVDHGTEQDGKAPNNLELHPVIGMSLTQF
jgi:hypothetical protein